MLTVSLMSAVTGSVLEEGSAAPSSDLHQQAAADRLFRRFLLRRKIPQSCGWIQRGGITGAGSVGFWFWDGFGFGWFLLGPLQTNSHGGRLGPQLNTVSETWSRSHGNGVRMRLNEIIRFNLHRGIIFSFYWLLEAACF